MSVKVIVNSSSRNRIAINNQQRQTIRTVAVGAQGSDGANGSNSLILLEDVDASDLDDNETLVYDANTNNFVVKILPIVDGGTF